MSLPPSSSFTTSVMVCALLYAHQNESVTMWGAMPVSFV